MNVVPVIGSWYMFGTVSLICDGSVHFSVFSVHCWMCEIYIYRRK